MIYPKSKVTVTALTVTTEITEEDEGDPRMLEVRLHDDESPGLISITDKNKDASSIAFFVEQWAALRGAVDQLAGCARTHDEVMGKPRESSDGGLEMALGQMPWPTCAPSSRDQVDTAQSCTSPDER